VKELRATLFGARGDLAASAQVRAAVEAAAKGRDGDAEAYPLYLQGRFFADRHTKEDTAKAVGYYRQAVALDPEYALAWAWLARAYADQAAYAWAAYAETFERARSAAESALQLEPDLPEGHAALGFVRMASDRDWEGAHASFRRALEIAPGNALVLRGAAVLAACLGRHDESVALLRRAVTLDPLSAPAQRVLGSRCLYVGLLDEAESAVRRALELSPGGGLTHYWLGMIDLAYRRWDQAWSAFRQEVNPVLRLLGLALADYARGRVAEAQATLKDLVEQHATGGAFQIASAYAYMGDSDRAFEWLQRADEQRDPGLIEIKAEILLRRLYTDPRWPGFLERLGFTHSASAAAPS